MFKKLISIVPAAALTLTVGANVQAATITVQKGDTLWDLAHANNTSVATIQTVNHLNTDLIHPGDLLTIAQEKHYTVKPGDTLWDIAIKHDVTISQIKEWNQLHSELIHPDLKLLILEGAKTSNTAASKEASLPTAQVQKESTSKVTVTVPSKNSNQSKESTPTETAPSTNNKIANEHTPETTTSNEVSKESTPDAPASSTSNTASNELIMEATAYTASCEGCSGITSTGINLKENPDAKVISVDPTVIPLGSKVYVEGYGEAIAGDTGGGIKGNKIDVFIPSKQDAVKFGVKQLKVTILD